MIKIVIADDHHIVRRGIRQIVLEEFSDAYIEEVSDAALLIRKIMDEKWDLVISDLSMPGRSGLEALPQIKQIQPHLPVLIMSIHPEEQYAIRVLKAGASGYLSKDMAPEELITAIHKVLNGKKYLSEAVSDQLSTYHFSENQQAKHEQLSDREFSVLKLIATGKSITEIADSLSLSITTVSTYRSRILQKMDLKANAELTIYCLENKLI